MPFTPDQLTNVLTNLTLQLASHLVIEQEALARHVPISTVQSTLLDLTEDDSTYYDAAVASEWTSPLENIADDLDTVADDDHIHTAAQVGLEDVENLSPSMMPISNDAQDALNLKLNVDDLTGVITEWTLSIPPEW